MSSWGVSWGAVWGDSWGGGTPAPILSNTPGFHIPGQFKVEDEADKLARRIREGTIKLPAAPREELGSEYLRQSERLAEAIVAARAEAAVLRPQIEALERRVLASIADQRTRLEHQLLLAQQRQAFIAVQEAQLLEEMEVLDIAFIAAVAVTLQ